MRSLIAAAAMAVIGTAAYADGGLPKHLAWTAYGTTSSGYAQSVGIGNMLKAKYDTDLRIIPGKNDVSRMLPIKVGQADICACGIAAYFGQEGVFMFADDRWGPTKLYNLFNNIGRNGQSTIVAGDLHVKSFADLKGKRVSWVKGSPALQVNLLAALAFGGLTLDDVQVVVVPGWGQSMQAIIDGQSDAAVGSTISSIFNQLGASPRGLTHVALPFSDTEAWARAKAVAPFWNQQMISNAVDIESNTSGKVPYEGNNYPYPIFVGMDKLDTDLAYNLTKAVMENYEVYKDSGPGMDGYQLQNQNFEWVFPYHEGAIRFYKEAGVWTDAAQANQDMLLKRLEVLAAAWKDFKGMDVSKDEHEAKWLEVRAKHLSDAGMPVPFKDPLPEPN
ncbi:MAG: TAXI family TRAP transporter solute-binding subunit [Alphaproteobacteria bacterium]|nr:TAXI family TRAP transporter solute-binding subunit [Alphaproteobacteria bacterium]MCB9928593.1 TAXI family TRAP transporter solute-binding subunit [Alphaproteobacteria bacterium]